MIDVVDDAAAGSNQCFWQVVSCGNREVNRVWQGILLLEKEEEGWGKERVGTRRKMGVLVG